MTLYILKAIPSGLIEIGISGQFNRRLSAIRRQNSEGVEVVRTYQGEGEYIRQLEKELHEELNAIRWQCEWFYGGSEVDCVVSRLDRDFSFMRAEAPEKDCTRTKLARTLQPANCQSPEISRSRP